MIDVVNFEEEFANKERIWERIKIERPDLSDLWMENVKDAINDLPIRLQKSILMSIASWALVTNGYRGTHGYVHPFSSVSWINNPSYRKRFSVEEIGALLKLWHYFKSI